MNEDAVAPWVAPWVAHNKDRELLQLTLNKKITSRDDKFLI